MRAPSFGLLVFALALAQACGNSDGSKSNAGSGGVAASASGGGSAKGGAANASGGAHGGELGGAGVENSAGAPDANAEARQPLCEKVCATEAELSCPPVRANCLKGWCKDPVEFFPHCLDIYDLMIACMAEQPADGFECSDGLPYPKAETCEDEQAALTGCIQEREN